MHEYFSGIHVFNFIFEKGESEIYFFIFPGNRSHILAPKFEILNMELFMTSLTILTGKRLVFHSIQYRNGCLAAFDRFDMFAQSIKFFTLHYQYRCLKNMIHQIDSKNGWLLLSASFTAKFGLVFVLTLENIFLEVSFSSQQKEHRFF